MKDEKPERSGFWEWQDEHPFLACLVWIAGLALLVSVVNGQSLSETFNKWNTSHYEDQPEDDWSYTPATP
jgi:hypothetical protein